MGYGDPRQSGDSSDAGRSGGRPASPAAATATSEKGGRSEPRPGGRPEPGGSADNAPPPASRAHARGASSGVVPVLLALLVGIALGIGGALVFGGDGDGGGDPFAGQIDRSSYQAVILANDRVYFGQIREANEEFYRLENAFFLRESRADEAAEPVRALLPVNREIHGPENEMLIAKSEVVLVEDLAEDSPILREIERQESGSE